MFKKTLTITKSFCLPKKLLSVINFKIMTFLFITKIYSPVIITLYHIFYILKYFGLEFLRMFNYKRNKIHSLV